MSTRRELLLSLGSLAVGGAVWWPTGHRLFVPDQTGVFADGAAPDWVMQVLEGQVRRWEAGDRGAIEQARRTNAEWDFMGRTFLTLALGNQLLRDRSWAPRALAVMDRMLTDTLAVERVGSMYAFLMPYASAKPWKRRPEASLFVDGEILLMLAVRTLLGDDRWRPELMARARLVVSQLGDGPIGSAESYPDECWTFCNAVALAALKIAGPLIDLDAEPAIDRWVAGAKAHLVDPVSGLLASSYTHDGRVLDGPEGSSIFLAAHMLQVIDPEWADALYAAAKHHLAGRFLGFGYAREWPAHWRGPHDVDSGPTVPVLDASPGASGLAVLGAKAFGDAPYFAALSASLEVAAFPIEAGGQRRYAASNVVGDAVLAYAGLEGPLWGLVAQGRVG